MTTCNESSMRWMRSSNDTASAPDRTGTSNSPPDLPRLFRSPSSEPAADRSPADRQPPLAAKPGEQAADRGKLRDPSGDDLQPLPQPLLDPHQDRGEHNQRRCQQSFQPVHEGTRVREKSDLPALGFDSTVNRQIASY